MELPSSEFIQNFEQRLRDYEIQHQGSFRKPWTYERINEVINFVKNAKISMTNTESRTSMSYYWLSKYDIITNENEEYLIFKRKNPNEPIIRIIPREEYFNIINSVHNECKHGGRDKMINIIKNGYYVTKKAIEIFVSLCPTCNNKRNPRKLTETHVSQNFNIGGEFNLIDFQSCPDGEYKWLLCYQDNTTKFINLRPLKTNTLIAISMELTKIFLTLGPPYNLQSKDGEFTEKVIRELNSIWPECKVKCSKQNQDECSKDVESMLRNWMVDKKCNEWSIGCYFCQYHKNVTLHKTIRKTPYKALFGIDPKTYVTNIPIQEQVKNIDNLSGNQLQDNLKISRNKIHLENKSQFVNIEEQFINIKNVPCNKQFNERSISHSNAHETLNIGHNNTHVEKPTQFLIIELEEQLKNIKNEPSDISIDVANDSMDVKHSNANAIIEEKNVDIKTEEQLKNMKQESYVDYIGVSDEKLNINDTSKTIDDKQCICIIKSESIRSLSWNEGANPDNYVTEFGTNPHISNMAVNPGLTIDNVNIKSLDNKPNKINKLDVTDTNETHSIKRAKINTARAIAVGTTVLINIPKVDQLSNIKKIKGKVVDYSNGVYKVGTKTGTLKNWFAEKDLDVLIEYYDDEVLDTPISLSEAVSNEAQFGRSFIKCFCRPSRNQCRKMRCACFKKKVICGSKCHSGISCVIRTVRHKRGENK